MVQNILLLEDDSVLSREIKHFLESKAYNCTVVYDGNFVTKQMKLQNYDLAILDINVPGLNGLDVCKEIRKFDTQISILMLTAFGEIEDKVSAFNIGADDYLVKPFHFDELLVRVIALLRRKEIPQNVDQKIAIADLEIDVTTMEVYRNNTNIPLSPKEFKLLTILANAKGKVVSKAQIADLLWDYHIETNHNSIEVYINFLRKKIDADNAQKLIHTKVGYGYYLKEE